MDIYVNIMLCNAIIIYDTAYTHGFLFEDNDGSPATTIIISITAYYIPCIYTHQRQSFLFFSFNFFEFSIAHYPIFQQPIVIISISVINPTINHKCSLLIGIYTINICPPFFSILYILLLLFQYLFIHLL